MLQVGTEKLLLFQKNEPPDFINSGIDTTQHLAVDTTRIRNELGYKELISQDEALRKTVVWERSHLPEKFDPKMFDYKSEDEYLENLG